MVQDTKRKRTGKYIPNALTASKHKNQSMGRTRRKRERAQSKEAKNEQRPNR